MKEQEPITPQSASSRVALRHLVVQRLLKAIIQGKMPAGTRLIASKLAVQLGVSPTPIREALVELEQSGVVELLHNRGALVRPFGRPELRDFYAVRGLLEGEAVRLACGRAVNGNLSLLRCDLETLLGEASDCQEKWTTSILALDLRIHAMPIEHCSNKRLIAEIKRYEALGETMRGLMGFQRAWHQEAMLPFMDLLDAMQNQRAAVAAEAMHKHISIVSAMAETALFDEKISEID